MSGSRCATCDVQVCANCPAHTQIPGDRNDVVLGACAQVKNGKGSMPAWADSLSPSDIQDVTAYVYNQAANDLW